MESKVTFALKDFSTYIKGSILGKRVLVKPIFLIEAVIRLESLQINRRVVEQVVSSREKKYSRWAAIADNMVFREQKLIRMLYLNW